MLPQEVIRAKRDGGKLGRDEIEYFVRGIADGTIASEQVAAFAMAVFFRGMDMDERVDLTRAMMRSGDVLDWPDMPGPVVDKHSTGGVGDNVSLMLAPMLAACGAYVPMISGRGLGHTGGTLDKLEAISGYVAKPDNALFRKVVREVGCAIIGQTARLAPADQRLYSIRDVTATVESIPLITASILSKKLAAGLSALVMDVKSGSGAFMPSLESARELAQSIATVATGAGTPTVALLTDMNEPLASAAGNAVEVLNAVDYLTGARRDARLHEVTLALAAEPLVARGLARDLGEARAKLQQALDSGAAAERFERMVAALGGPSGLLRDARALLPKAPVTVPARAPRAGYVAGDRRACGRARCRGTRRRQEKGERQHRPRGRVDGTCRHWRVLACGRSAGADPRARRGGRSGGGGAAGGGVRDRRCARDARPLGNRTDRALSLLLAMTEWRPEPWKERLQALLPGRRIDTLDKVDRESVRYALTWRHPPGSLRDLPKLEVIFSLGAGVDHVFADPQLPDVPVARVVDTDLTQRMSEWVVLQVLLHHRQFRRYDRQQRERIWDEDERQPSAQEVRVGVLGLGVLGLDAARKLKTLGFDVAGWSRTAKRVEGLATFHAAEGLDALLARSDILVSLLPLTPQTRGLLNAKLIDKLPRDGRIGPVLINAGRGGLQVEADIITALQAGRLKGASLDVFETEPLTQGSPLWGREDVFVSPHNAAISAPEAVAKNIAEQIVALEQGKGLRNLIDRERGY